MKITVLDADTLGKDLSLEPLKAVGDVTIYNYSDPDEVIKRITDCEVVIINKIKLNETNLKYAKNLKLICIAATGYDNVDVEYCREHNIAVCNVVGYSTNSVALLTVSMALSLVTHLRQYNKFVVSGEYTKSGIPNRLEPAFHELDGMMWGIVGLGNIGKKVAKIASAMGCNVIANKRSDDPDYNIVSIDELIERSDIISVHTPLTDLTRGLISAERIGKMKKNAILINVARGAVCDEKALADAIKADKIGGLGIDVYSNEPFSEEHPFYEIKSHDNVLLTPHNAWGAYEARERCLYDIIENIKSFCGGGKRSRVDIL
ncbi:MAG: hydroxyacid dehydrogenase [Ruminococcaceae bacterium]|nr:hydroxyacid dehydrogenase [Oscillospiraceae bacterium]